MRLYSAIPTFAFLFATAAAHADVYTTFQLTGTLGTGPITGTALLDTSTGQFTQGSFQGSSFGEAFSFTAQTVTQSASSAATTDINFQDGAGNTLDLQAPLASFLNYTAGPFDLCAEVGNCIVLAGYNVVSELTTPSGMDALFQGTLAPEATAVTPEPSGLALGGAGLAALVGVLRRQRPQRADLRS